MKEQVKSIVIDFKNLGWTVQKLESDLQFSNGTIGKVLNGKAGMSDFKFCKLLELHKLTFVKEPEPTPELLEEIAENNKPENKAAIEEERNPTEESPLQKRLRENREKFQKQYKN